MSPEERARLSAIGNAWDLIAALEQARYAPSEAIEFAQPFILLLVLSPELLACERAYLIKKGARLFGCTTQSLRNDYRRSCQQKAVGEIHAEIMLLEKMWKLE